MEHQSLIKLREVEARTGYRRSSIYRLAARGEFPSPIKLGDRASAWVETEISAWISERIRASRKPIERAAK